jgi:hypothetical protein
MDWVVLMMVKSACDVSYRPAYAKPSKQVSI